MSRPTVHKVLRECRTGYPGDWGDAPRARVERAYRFLTEGTVSVEFQPYPGFALPVMRVKVGRGVKKNDERVDLVLWELTPDPDFQVQCVAGRVVTMALGQDSRIHPSSWAHLHKAVLLQMRRDADRLFEQAKALSSDVPDAVRGKIEAMRAAAIEKAAREFAGAIESARAHLTHDEMIQAVREHMVGEVLGS